MHYKNGRESKIGDLVRGRGYNLNYEFTGVLIAAQPGSIACNCQVATITDKSAFWYVKFGSMIATTPGRVEAITEYGQLDAFVAINPLTGDVLEPEGSTNVDAAKESTEDRPQAIGRSPREQIAAGFDIGAERARRIAKKLKERFTDAEMAIIDKAVAAIGEIQKETAGEN